MVDMYIPSIAASLLDPSIFVRRTTLLLLSQLILQDYIKWRESLLHYFLHVVIDVDEELAALATHVLSGPLYLKCPSLFTSKFVETVFVLNNVRTPSLERSGLVTLAEVRRLSLPGIFVRSIYIYYIYID